MTTTNATTPSLPVSKNLSPTSIEKQSKSATQLTPKTSAAQGYHHLKKIKEKNTSETLQNVNDLFMAVQSLQAHIENLSKTVLLQEERFQSMQEEKEALQGQLDAEREAHQEQLEAQNERIKNLSQRVKSLEQSQKAYVTQTEFKEMYECYNGHVHASHSFKPPPYTGGPTTPYTPPQPPPQPQRTRQNIIYFDGIPYPVSRSNDCKQQ